MEVCKYCGVKHESCSPCPKCGRLNPPPEMGKEKQAPPPEFEAQKVPEMGSKEY